MQLIPKKPYILATCPSFGTAWCKHVEHRA